MNPIADLAMPPIAAADPDGELPTDLATAPLQLLCRLAAARPAYTTRFVRGFVDSEIDRIESGLAPRHEWRLLTGPEVRPEPGDVMLARVGVIGQHQRLESPGGRRAKLFVGDDVLVACGNRYAPDQFEAAVPTDLSGTHLVAAGGVAGNVLSAAAWMKPATELEPIGLVEVGSSRLRLLDHAPYAVQAEASARQCFEHRDRPRVLAVLGSSMNSGKSTTLAHLARGLTNAGLTVAAGKVTGTGAGGDPHLFADAGAATVLDFTHFGYASTYRLANRDVQSLWRAMLTALSTAHPRPDVVLIEVADGVYQQETSALLQCDDFAAHVDGVVFAAADALGAAAGVGILESAGLPVVAVSGCLTSAPLMQAEATRWLGVPVLATDSLVDPDVATMLAAVDR